MKKSAIFLAVSALAGSLLVGGTFAAWAVTDNADPFGVKITPSEIDTGDTKSVTLEWGDKGLVDIQNLSMGEEKGPYAVGLKATTSDASAFTGSLSVSLTTTATGELKLIDYLHVYVYEEAAKEHLVLEVPDASKNYTIAKDIVVTSGTVKNVYFFIKLDDTMTTLQYNAVLQDVVTLTVDWNKGSNVEEVTSRTLYFNNTSSWADVYVYAWKDGEGSENAAYPGVKMAVAKGAIYTAAIEAKFDKVIFNNGLQGEGNQTADLTIDASKPYYDGEWKAAPDLSAETAYYLVGTFNEWTTVAEAKLTALETAHDGYTYALENLALQAGAKFKVVSSDNVWYAEHGHTGSEVDMSVNDENVYSFYFNPEGVGDNEKTYIKCEYIRGVNYYVVGTFEDSEWAVLEANKLTFVDDEDDSKDHYTIEKTFAKDDQLLIRSEAGSYYKNVGTWDNCHFTINDDGNVVVADAGTYTVNLWLNSAEGNHIELVAKA